MFRFVSTNALQSLKPVLLQNFRNNSGIIALQQPTNLVINQNAINSNFYRYNSSSTLKANSILSNGYEEQIEKIQEDPFIRQAIRDEAQIKLNYFKEQCSLLYHYRNGKDDASQNAFSETVHNLLHSFQDAELRSVFTKNEFKDYASALNFMIYNNRTRRLKGSKNVDKDQYSSSTTIEAGILKKALLELNELIVSGEVKDVLNVASIISFINAMSQFQLYEACLDVWEQGVNDAQVGKLFLTNGVLAVILPIAYNTNRFLYEEIIRIYELNTSEVKTVEPSLICAIGKIAISAGDYARGLDNLEKLLKQFENQTNSSQADYYLGDLHLAFIGKCKDISIAKHFFDKVVNNDLPYNVKLKVPHVQNLLENCFENNESFDSILYFWQNTISHYKNDKRSLEINSRYSILNNSFSKIFFQVYPELNKESFNQLKNLIKIYNDIKGVDEVFLNTFITNYTWKDKVVFNQLIENYDTFKINRTQVSYRVCLKKIGEVKGFSNEEILEKWNESLISLDKRRFKYIPVADWASLRDATIWTKEDKDVRKEFYWKVLNSYKSYFQDRHSCNRFIWNWLKNDHALADLKTKVIGKEPEIQIPKFRNLTKAVDFDRVFDQVVYNKNQQKFKQHY